MDRIPQKAQNIKKKKPSEQNDSSGICNSFTSAQNEERRSICATDWKKMYSLSLETSVL